ncbi:MAG: flagellar basal body P-ring protein FlgI [Deltaproteobacteria bacterium]|nr:flagellar basal body P-ring protein FlgI [Deltaproteobacteria bacterium]
MRRKSFPTLFFFVSIVLFSLCKNSFAARIKDVAYVNGVRPNQLIGYGLVVGLNGTGDKSSTIFTNQSLSNMLERMGIKVSPSETKVSNVAAVIVTAALPPFAKPGIKIDAIVSSIGDAKSLEGGMLLATPLRGMDGEIYGIAQGPLVVGGFQAQGAGATVQKNHTTVGRIPNGVIVERGINQRVVDKDSLIISLRDPDFTNAIRIAEEINKVFKNSATARDAATVRVLIPDEMRDDPVKFVSVIENLEIRPDTYAKVVVNEKTGTVVIGENVRISTVAVSHGNISIQIKERFDVSQPSPFGRGETVVTPDTSIRVEEEKGRFFILEGGITIKELVSALNAIGATARDIIVILQTIKAAGALHAELEVI